MRRTGCLLSIVPAATTTFLIGCATPASRTVVVAPPIVDYTAEEQSQWADELEGVPPDSMIWRTTIDYVHLRDQIRKLLEGRD